DITSINANAEEKVLDVIVEEDQLSLAIGRRGQNVRLAAMLTGWKVNIISKSKLQEKVKASVENLSQIEGVNEATAQVLIQNGVMSVVDLSATDADDLRRFLDMEPEQAQELVEAASNGIENEEIENEPAEEAEIVSASAVPSARMGMIKSESAATEEDDDQKFSEAERRLREELAAFKLK
ncbi:MAG: helix-hairpin-helix domain-containing protein, partial [Bacteriovoracaceae bacterium]